MKIVLLDADTLGPDIDLSAFGKLGEFVIYRTTNETQRFERAQDADIIITNKVVFDRSLLSRLPNLKLIALTATGMNNVDLDAAKEFGVAVKNVAGYSTKSVAQHTFTMVLPLLGKLGFYDRYVRRGKWFESPIFTNLDMPFHELDGKHWGIIGLGAIGREVAHIAEAFGCKVCYYSTSGVKREEKYPSVTLDKMLQTCDIISIHAPLNDKTKLLIGEKELIKMRQDAILVNVGRGGIVEEKALMKALNAGRIYAAVDVMEREPMARNSPLAIVKRKERLIVTPHIAWGSVEARERLMKAVYQNIKTFIDKGV